MDSPGPETLIGRDKQLSYVDDIRKRLRNAGVECLWVTGESGSGKSQFLQVCMERARRTGWEVLYGQCSEETRADPYGPFLSMLGLCFDKSGRLINDRSVYSIVDQISFDDVMDAVADIPGLAVVALGIRVGKSIFESRRTPQPEDELLNRNFEFILQVIKLVDNKRLRPVFMAIDDLHLASSTTYALLNYLLTRLQGARLLIAATWCAESLEKAEPQIHSAFSGQDQVGQILDLPELSDEQMRTLLNLYAHRPLDEALGMTLIRFSRGLPGILRESVRLVELDGRSGPSAEAELGHSGSPMQAVIARQVGKLSPFDRALLECMALIGLQVSLDMVTAPPLCAYLGIGERMLLLRLGELADEGAWLVWDGERRVRFTSPFVRQYLVEQPRLLVARHDHLRIAESWQAAEGELYPALLAEHYLAGGDGARALHFALQSAEELVRSAAFPEAVQSYRLALQALDQAPDDEARYDVLRAASLAAEQAGDWDEALALLQQTLVLCEGDPARQAEVLAGLGWLYAQRGQIQAALEHLDRSAAEYARLDDVLGRAQVEYYRGVVYSRQKEWRRAVECFERYLHVSEQSGLDEGRASAYVELGNLHRLQRHWEPAEMFLQQGIALAEAQADYVLLAQAYNYLGSCYALQGKPQAVEMLHRALDIVSKRTKQPAQEARIQNTLAETLVRQNRWAEAEAAFHASAAIKKQLRDRGGLAITYGGLGRLYLRQWRFDEAASFLQQDVDLLREELEANVAWIQQWTNLIGEVRRLQGQYDRAALHLAAALALAERIPDEQVRTQSRAFTRMLLARLAMDRGDLETAEVECAAALAVLGGTWAEAEIRRTAARLARLSDRLPDARSHLDRALAASERGEDIDRALTYLEDARLCAAEGSTIQAQERASQVIEIARRLQNAELERRTQEWLGGTG